VLAGWKVVNTFVGVYFKGSIRTNASTHKMDTYYRLVESYRNEDGRVCHRTMLNVGFIEGATPDLLNATQAHLNARYRSQDTLFAETDGQVTALTTELWQRLVSEKRIDVEMQKAERMVHADTIQHSDVREVGAEWLCHNTWNQLQLSHFLQSQGWSESQIQLAATQVISRAVYPASEFKTTAWIKENSAVCELTGYDMDHLTKDKLYQGALNLFALREPLQKHLSQRTNTLFDLEDKIILYDLTNTYFEGRMQHSTMAQRGRSKEKRSDAKLLVLAMVVNVEGFVKYINIHEGNMADSKTLLAMIERLETQAWQRKPIVVLDAGIATNDNLKLLQTKGYAYVCVSRSKLKNYTAIADRCSVVLETKSKQQVHLKAIQTADSTDYYLEVKSPAKALKEQGMKDLFETRYEQELQKIKAALLRKGGVKKIEKVHERIGRAKEKYPSVHSYYHLQLSTANDKIQATDLTWQKDEALHQQKTDSLGLYFLRTNLTLTNEVNVWNIYNTIREIESTFRCLKTELDLRPVYHKNDDSSMAHLHLGILAYWLVNTIRHQLKAKGIRNDWREITRIANTQKMITTSGKNTFDTIIQVRKCSEPNDNLKKIYDILHIKHKPFRKQKSVVHKPPPKNFETHVTKQFSE
jgi:transposase